MMENRERDACSPFFLRIDSTIKKGKDGEEDTCVGRSREGCEQEAMDMGRGAIDTQIGKFLNEDVYSRWGSEGLSRGAGQSE